MSAIRVLVGTKKGGFVITSDGTRQKWKVSGPLFSGWEIYHMKGSPTDPNRIYASQTSGWFGQVIQRSDDGGKTWITPGSKPDELKSPEGMPKGESNKFVYDTSPETGKPLTTHQWYDGTQHPWEFKRVWHVEPSLHDPDTVYAGVEDAALFRSTDGGKTWHELAGLRGHGRGRKWSPGAGGMGLHTIVLDPNNPKRMYIAISAAGAFRTDDGGKKWKADQQGPEVAISAGSDAGGRLLRASNRDASVASPTCSSCNCTRAAAFPQRQRRGPMAGSERQFADGFRLSDRRSCSRAEDDLCRADGPVHARAAGREAAGVSQQDGRQRVGADDEGLAARELLHQRAARRDGGRFAGPVRDLFRHDRRAGVLLAGCGEELAGDRATICRLCFRSKCRRCLVKIEVLETNDSRCSSIPSANAGPGSSGEVQLEVERRR